MRQIMIGAGFTLLGATGLHRLSPAALRGLGAILMVHRVVPASIGPFRPNGLLEITPAFLEALILHLRRRRYDIVTLDEALGRMSDTSSAKPRPFAVLSFDDGYRDNRLHALPILERHAAPFTLYATPGFLDRTAWLWWLELEQAILRGDRLEIEVRGETLRLPMRDGREKWRAWTAIYTRLRQGDETELRDVMSRLCTDCGIDRRALVDALCMDWEELGAVARHPLATIGAHTMTHPRLAKLDPATMMDEIASSRAVIEARIGRPVRHFAYPIGDPSSAGAREFSAAHALGFASAVTTRPGLIVRDHAAHATALPRLSVNGNWQSLTNIDILLSGAAFALYNRGRTLDVA